MTGHPAGDGVDLLVRAAETAVLIGEYRPAVAFGRRAIARVDPAADPDRAAALLERQRWYLWQAGDRAAAAEALAEAARLVPERPPSASRARILAHQAGILMSEGRFADSIPIAEAALGDARAVDSVPDEALALGILGADLALLGRIDEGLDRVREALAIAERIGSTEGIALGATNLAVLLDRVGRTEDALDVAISGWQRTREIGVERTYGGLLLAIAAKAALALGRWDEADDFLRRGLARDPVGAPGIRLRIQRGRLDTFRGDLEAATETLRTARAADDAVGGTEDRAAILAALAELAVAQDHTTNVRAAVAEGLRLAAAGSTEPALAGLAVAGLRAEADAAARARARRDDAGLVDARRRATAIAGQLERLAGIHPTSVGAEAGEGRADAGRRARGSLPCRAAPARRPRHRVGLVRGGRRVRRHRATVSGRPGPGPRGGRDRSCPRRASRGCGGPVDRPDHCDQARRPAARRGDRSPRPAGASRPRADHHRRRTGRFTPTARFAPRPRSTSRRERPRCSG